MYIFKYLQIQGIKNKMPKNWRADDKRKRMILIVWGGIQERKNTKFQCSIWIWFFPDSGMVNLIYNYIVNFLLIGLVWFVVIARFPLEYWLFFVAVFTLLRSILLLGLSAWLLVKLMLFLYNLDIFVLLFCALYLLILLFLLL